MSGCRTEFPLGHIPVTLHPVVVYYKNDSTSDGSLNCKSFCVVSDEREHNAIAVHKFIQVVIGSLKLLLPNFQMEQAANTKTIRILQTYFITMQISMPQLSGTFLPLAMVKALATVLGGL